MTNLFLQLRYNCAGFLNWPHRQPSGLKMKKTRTHFISILGFLVAIGIGTYLFIAKQPVQNRLPIRDQTSSKLGGPMGKNDSQVKTADQSKQKQTENLRKLPNKSKDEWLTWIKETAHFRIERTAGLEDALFQFDSAAFKEAGLPGLGHLTNKVIQEYMRALYRSDGALKSQLEQGLPTLHPDFMPKMVSSTPNSSTFVFAKSVPPEIADIATKRNIIDYYENRGKSLRQRIDFSLKYDHHAEAERRVGPEFAESVAEWCMRQPVLRRFGNTDLTVTFEDIDVNGKRVFKITESMPGLDGGPAVINKFTSPEMPAPYNRFLLTK